MALLGVMAVAALSALIREAGKLHFRRIGYLDQAGLHRFGEADCTRLAREIEDEVLHPQVGASGAAAGYDDASVQQEVDGVFVRLRASLLEKAEYHRAMRTKYERAALRPWAGVPPDPPYPHFGPRRAGG